MTVTIRQKKKKKPIIEKSAERHARRLLRFLSKHKETISPLLILTHDYPDPDSLASAISLQYLAERYFGIQSKIVYGGIIGRMENRSMVTILKMPVYRLKPGDFSKYEHFALLDTQPGFKNNSFPTNKRATIIIDQHPSVSKPNSKFCVVDTECGATSVILANALLLTRGEIPVRIATALAYGILSDTLNLHRANRADIIQTYLEILPHCDLKVLARIQNPARSRKFFVTLSKSIQQAVVRRGLIIAHLGIVESPDLVSQTADFLLTYKGRRWSLCTGRFKSKLHVSLRSNLPNVEAGEILRDIFANRGEAGGWGGIAGGSFEVSKSVSELIWEGAEFALVERLLKRLRIPIKGEFYSPFKQKE